MTTEAIHPNTIARRITDGGHEIVRVQLTNCGEVATLDAADWDKLHAAGLCAAPWYLSWGRHRGLLYVRTHPRGGHRVRTLAREVAAAPAGARVRYIDGDRTNLRRENLAVRKAPGRSQDSLTRQLANAGVEP